MEIDEGIIKERLNKLFEEENDCPIRNICIYPYGELGKSVHNLIKEQYKNINVVCIFDNYLCNNNDIKHIEELVSFPQQSIDKILICTVTFYNEILSSIPDCFKNKTYSMFFKKSEISLYDSINIRKYPYDNLTFVLQFQTNNRIKETELKKRIRRDSNKKVKVCFLVSYISRLGFLSIYNRMISDGTFTPFILLYNAHENLFYSNNNSEKEWNKHCESFDYLKNKGYKVINGYDEKRGFIPLDNFDIDIIITEDVYLDPMLLHYSNAYINTNYLVCYLNYGFNVSNSFDYHYNNPISCTGWKIFVETKPDYSEFMKHSKYCGLNVVLTGSPRLDHYSEPINEHCIPNKINNGKPIIIYAPHWTIDFKPDYLSYGTFHLYYNFFLNLAKTNPQFNFVFKPHPELSRRLNYLGIMSYDEYEDYLNQWNSLDNGYVYEQGDYIDLFRKSALLIQDSGSFICEWLPSLNPCIYLINPINKDNFYEGYSSLARNILKSYYHCFSVEDIQDCFNSIMVDKKDPLYKAREKSIKDNFINIGSAGEKIVNYLKKVLLD